MKKPLKGKEHMNPFGRRLLSLRVLIVTAAVWFCVAPAAAAGGSNADQAPGRAMAQQATKARGSWTTADHSRLKPLQQVFTSGLQVTRACVSCHSEAEAQFHQTIHWTWMASPENDAKKRGKAGNSLNNFCISTNATADEGCMSCHPGWGKKTEAVNCLACHGHKDLNWEEAFEDYNAFAAEEDQDSRELAAEIQADIQAAVKTVGLPERKNCGSCHFYGGGGDGVKHGDLDTSLVKPNKDLDVHMGVDGQDFNCVRCHTTRFHNIAGRIYTAPASTHRKSLVEDDLTAKITCESCHSATPHRAGSKVNDHTDKVACQTCHIPRYARVNPTKMSWDWSKAGHTKDGKPYKTKGAYGKHDYLSIKGQMRWEKNQVPEYFWFNGSIDSLTAADFIDPGRTVQLSHPVGDRSDKNARIFPFKVHRGVQPYDKIHKTFLTPLLSGPDGYWKTLDWQRALSKGSDALGLPYSGQFDFVESTYVFPITHMVAPKDNVLDCSECHVGEGSRLAALGGFYMPGRDGAGLMDRFGWVMVLGALVSVCLHGLMRIFNNGRKE